MTTKDFNKKTVVITRPVERSESMAKIIRENNGIPLIIPTLELQLVKSEELIYIAENIKEYDWIIFTSPAGVKSFFEVYTESTIPSKIAVIGVKTEEVLQEYNNTPDLIPENFTAEGLLESFKSIDLEDKNIALPRTLSARKVLPEGLEEYGANVTIAEAYTSSTPQDTSKLIDLMEKIINNEIDIITFTSPLTVTNLLNVIKQERKEQYDAFINQLRTNIIVGSIGPITGNVLKQHNIPAIEPKRYTVKDMIDALLQNI